MRDETKRSEYDADSNWNASTNESDFMKDSSDKYDAIFNEYSAFGRNPKKDWMIGADFSFTQSDNIPKSAQVLNLKVSFQEAARGGSRRIRVRLRAGLQNIGQNSKPKHTTVNETVGRYFHKV